MEDRQTDRQTGGGQTAVTKGNGTLNLKTCESRTLATRQAEGGVATGETADILLMMSQCGLGEGAEPGGVT